MKKKPGSMNHSKAVGLALLTVSMLALNAFPQSLDSNFFIFLAFGQSNMEGYASGSVTQIETQDTTNVPNRFQLLPAVDWSNNSRTKGTWTKAIPPLCRSSTGLCPCDYFGRTLVDSLPSTIKIGIINVAVAGCAIEMFDKAKYQSYISSQADWMKTIANGYGGSPYARLVEMAKVAQNAGVIKGILLHQGESGATSGDNWSTEVKKIYSDLIKDLSLDSNKVPLLAGDLTNDNSHTSVVWNLANTKNFYIVSSDGCGVNSTSIHFSSAGYRSLGKNYADSMLVAFKKLGTGSATAIAQPNKKFGYAMGNGFELKTGSASVSFEIPQRAFVTLKAYTLSGKEIAELAAAEYSAGKHIIEFGRNVMPAGLTILKIKAGAFSATQTIMVAAH